MSCNGSSWIDLGWDGLKVEFLYPRAFLYELIWQTTHVLNSIKMLRAVRGKYLLEGFNVIHLVQKLFVLRRIPDTLINRQVGLPSTDYRQLLFTCLSTSVWIIRPIIHVDVLFLSGLWWVTVVYGLSHPARIKLHLRLAGLPLPLLVVRWAISRTSIATSLLSWAEQRLRSL